MNGSPPAVGEDVGKFSSLEKGGCHLRHVRGPMIRDLVYEKLKLVQRENFDKKWEPMHEGCNVCYHMQDILDINRIGRIEEKVEADTGIRLGAGPASSSFQGPQKWS